MKRYMVYSLAFKESVYHIKALCSNNTIIYSSLK